MVINLSIRFINIRGCIKMINYDERLDKFQTYLNDQKLEIGLITDPANVFYLTGLNSNPHERFMGLVVDTRKNETMLFLPTLDVEIAKSDSVIKEIIPITDEQDPFAILSERLGTDVSSMGLEMGVVTMMRHQLLQDTFAKATFTDVTPELNKLRTNKSRGEIEYLQEAVDIIEKVLTEGIKEVKIGMTEAELVAHFEFLMKKFGAIGPSFETIVLAGEKSALPHGVPSDRKIANGDFLLIDFGVTTRNGYHSDMTRTFIVGEASDQQKLIYNLVRAANEAGIDAVRSNVPVKMFDLAARKVIEDGEHGEYFTTRVGHGLGLELHEAPSVHGKNEMIAEPGLFFTIEPGIYMPGFGGVRIEDEIYINEEGRAEVLTSYPKTLQILKG